MRGILVGIAAAAMSFASAQAQDQLENYAALPRIWASGLSPDGAHLATGCSPRGAREICLYDLEGDEPTRLIPAPEGGRIVDFFWPGNGHLVYWVDSFQTLNTNTTGLRAFTTRRAISYSLESGTTAVLLGDYASVTRLDEVTSSMVDREDRVAMELTLRVDQRARAGSRFGDRRTTETVVYEVSLENGGFEGTLETSEGSVLDFVLDARGEPVLEVRYDDDTGRYAIHRVVRGRPEIFSGDFPIRLPRIHGFMDDGASVAISLPERGLQKLDIATGEVSRIVMGEVPMELASPIVDRLDGAVVGFAYRDDLPRQMFLDEQLAGLQLELQSILTEQSITLSSWNRARSKLVVEARDVGMPANYYLLDMTTGGLGLLETEMTIAEGASIASRNRIRYTASDGLEIEAWLSLPPGAETLAGRYPLVVMPHGGPQAYDGGEFDWWAAYYASLGYAVLQPNFRGSSGRGAEFIEAGYGGFGTRMIDDIIDGVHHLQSEGIARDGAYCAAGGSYGGYAALMTALRDPGGVACVISYAGVTQPFAMLSDEDGNSGIVRYWEAYMGSRFEDRDYRASITPAARADEISAPVLALHGREDTTVPFGQMLALQDALDGRPDTRFVTLDGESHYLDTQASRETLLRESGAFLREHLPIGLVEAP